MPDEEDARDNNRRMPSATDLVILATWAVALVCLLQPGWTWASALGAVALTGLCCLALLTGRRQGQALRAGEERFRRIVETAHEGICLLDAQGRATYVNERLAQMLGYAREEMIGLRLFDLMVQTSEGEEERYSGLTSSEMRRAHDFRFRSRDGTTVWVQMSGSRIHSDSDEPQGALVMLIDIRERLRLEQRLRETSKLESMGALAAGITHNFNNLLQGIVGYTHILLERISDPEVERCGNQIRKFADRGAELVQELLAFIREHHLEVQAADVNVVIRDALDALRRTLGEGTDLEFAPAADLGEVRIDPGQIERILLNLADNARDAMPEGGTFRIETVAISIGPGGGREVPGVAPGFYVKLTVSDTGLGMDEETMRHAFEPFYTTKDVGKNAGMGLSSVYGIVKQHDGHTTVTSEPSQGTTFHIYLPQVGETAIEEDARVDA